MERIDPLEPIDRIDPLEAMLSSEPSRHDRDAAESLAFFTPPF
jgi:hypothetical protein